MSRTHFTFVVMTLAVVGFGLFLYKALVLAFPLVPGREEIVWNVEARVSFRKGIRPVKVSLFLPESQYPFSIVEEYFISRGYGLTTRTHDGNRQAVWSSRQEGGPQALYFRAVVRRMVRDFGPEESAPPELMDPGFQGAALEAAESVVLDIQDRSADVESLVSTLVDRVNREPRDENIRILLGKDPTTNKKIETVVRILAQTGIVARSAHGLALKATERDVPILSWLEVYNEGRWERYDPRSGGVWRCQDCLEWWKGPDPIASLKDGRNLLVTISVSENKEEAIRAALARTRSHSPLLLEFSLLQLPVRTQQVYRVLLLIPVGAFLVVLFRTVIGLNTFGTFMPVLIALAFRETQLAWGICLFSCVVALGLAFRFYLDRLKLLLVPRLASVLIIVIILMALLSLVTHKLGLEKGLSIALFPMVILTITIERMSIVWEERGALEAINQGLGSLFAAAVAYLVMANAYVEHLLFFFPELLLVLLAATLLFGRYTGYRLLELFRFRELTKKEL